VSGALVAGLAALAGRVDQSAAAQAGQVVGDPGPAGAKGQGEVGRVGGAVQQAQQDQPAGAAGQGGADALGGTGRLSGRAPLTCRGARPEATRVGGGTTAP
jgi:hypothetical protein